MISNSVHANAIAQGTPRSSYLSPVSSSATITPPWAPPKSPLPPHRLAKLANALGVSTPMPAVHQPTPFMSRSYLDSPGPSDTFRRSPTPSTPISNFTAYSPAISKYLLHVIPPLHLPHENDNDTDMTPPPSNASGYHTQFHRGTLVPMHSSLQSQLGAIAKEYALPSTAGLILYLVSSAKSPQARSPTPGIGLQEHEMDEPGPRLSEDIWKHLWTRVLKTEQRDDTLTPSLSKNPLGMTLGAQSTPYLPQESSSQPLRPFLSSASEAILHPTTNHFPPSPTTPSTTSDMRSNTKSAPPSSSSVYDPETPDTSAAASLLHDPATRANSLDLPGLISPSIIPILAKVEFDIDRRRAPWYDPWLRSRRMNHAKRAESRNGVRKGSITDHGENSDGSRERPRHIDLLMGRKQTGSPVSLVLSPAEEKPNPELRATPMSEQLPVPNSAEYEQLPEPEEDGWSDDESEEEDFESTARVATMTMAVIKDPLADVFGTDAETWDELQTSKRHTNPNVVDLALNAADLTALPSPTQSEFEHLGKEEDEVQALLDQMSRPTLSVSIPSSPPEKRSSSPASSKRHVPPPLVLIPEMPHKDRDLMVPTESSPMPSSASSTNLPYLNEGEGEGSSASGEPNESGDGEEDEFETDYARVKSPAESEKRGGAVFDDLDLGLDPTEDYDDNDPHDRRRSQFVMRAQLDEIERTLAQLSPRMLQNDLADEQGLHMATLSPSNSLTLSPGMRNADHFPPSPRLPQHPDIPDSPESEPQAAWPATPFSAIKSTSPPRRHDAPPSPPRLAVNGITTSAPKSYIPNVRSSSSEMSAETESRRRELEEEQGYPFRAPPPGDMNSANPSDSPVIPLSPDPFGRFASTPSIPSGSRQTSAYWENEPSVISPAEHLDTTSIDANVRKRSNSSATSRFSADSITGVEANAKPSNRTTLMTVNTIKRLWRKSTKNPSVSNTPPTPSSSSFPPLPPPRPSQELPDGLPKTPTFGRFSPQLAPPRRSQEMPPVPQASPQVSAPPPQLPNPHPQPQQQQQLSVPPPFGGRSVNPQPIVAAQMRPTRSTSTLDRLHFDQESPYPMPRRSPSYSPRPPSPPPLPSPSLQTTQLPSPTPTMTMANGSLPPHPTLAPPIALQDKEKPSIRKSILKGWKSSSISSNALSQQPSTTTAPEPRSSLERPNAGAPRGRRPSVLNFGSTRGSVVSPPPDIPPSPQIPQQFISRNSLSEHRQSVRSRLTNSSIDSSSSPPQMNKALSAGSTSPRRSMASSRGSQESRPSFDTSQFEIVSPKINSTLSYPYHGLDHSP
ncbi:hypothetical protein D9615_001154 [Tricholomella constricta]|uniref:Uncharacterized protein n=1 Tax=Tricholomella constricta TaxID=117010 RepID=A0A8H5M953_9AGAR|nr:hypothetical protein D9615_001154 [Tricholomella constricta]